MGLYSEREDVTFFLGKKALLHIEATYLKILCCGMIAFLTHAFKQQHNLRRGFVVSVPNQSISESFEMGETEVVTEVCAKTYIYLFGENRIVRARRASCKGTSQGCTKVVAMPSIGSVSVVF